MNMFFKVILTCQLIIVLKHIKINQFSTQNSKYLQQNICIQRITKSNILFLHRYQV